MQWSGEVLPELGMIPDISVFLCVTSVYSQAIFARGSWPLSYEHEIQEAFSDVGVQGKFPARLTLPFTLSPSDIKSGTWLRQAQPRS
jgi:hypothetical protein